MLFHMLGSELFADRRDVKQIVAVVTPAAAVGARLSHFEIQIRFLCGGLCLRQVELINPEFVVCFMSIFCRH